MTAQQFNEKYKDFLEEGHYGCDLHNEKALEYLDEQFQEFIKIKNFKYTQIKSKFNWFCFYNKGISRKKTEEVEKKLEEIYNNISSKK